MIRLTRQGSRNSTTRRIFGVLLVFWLNLAVLPCAMAFQGDDECPHCPPAEEQGAAAHHQHNEPTAASICATAQSDCCDLDAATVLSRSGKIENLPDNPDNLAVPVSNVSWPAPVTPAAPTHDIRPPDPGANTRPLHVLYCVYLD